MQVRRWLRLKARFRWHMLLAVAAYLLVFPIATFGQAATITVPDLTGLNVPQAAAVLNHSQLVLGSQRDRLWTETANIPPNTVSAQSVEAGLQVAPGTEVNVVVMRSPNVTFIYDDNDFTLQNNTGAPLNLASLVFNSIEGAPAAFEGRRWTRAIGPRQCVQVWSVTRYEPKDVEGCERIQNWLVTSNNTSEHFWTASNGVSQFNIVRNEAERGTCPAAPVGSEPVRCEVFIPANVILDETPFVYFAYTPRELIVLNPTDDLWMPLASLQIINQMPDVAGTTFAFGDPAVFGNPPTFGQIDRLAPGQCLLYTNSDPQSTTPQLCDVVARLDLTPNVAFWTRSFGVDSVSLEAEQQSCPAATEGKVTICIMPR